VNETLAIRIDAENPDHHLWRNGDTWWIHYTVHYETEPGAGRKRRVRYSLGTPLLDQARLLRDAIFAAWTEPPEPFPDSRIEVSDHEGLTLHCAAPDPAHARRLARIDRGDNMLGSLIDDFYVAVDKPWAPTSLVLWVGIDPSQFVDRGCIVPVARIRLADMDNETPDHSSRRTAAAHLLYAWIRHATNIQEDYQIEQHVEGGDLLDTQAVRHVHERACRGLPLDLPRVSEREQS